MGQNIRFWGKVNRNTTKAYQSRYKQDYTKKRLYQEHYITTIITTLIIPSLPCFSGLLIDFSSKNGYFNLFWAQNGDLGAIELSEKVGTACKFYQYTTKIITILFIPTLLCFSGVSVDISPKNGNFDTFWAHK